jgi:hypothetical protein
MGQSTNSIVLVHGGFVDGCDWQQVYDLPPVCLVHPGGPGIGREYLRMPALEAHLTVVYLEPIGTGHMAHLEEADAFATAVAGFAELRSTRTPAPN